MILEKKSTRLTRWGWRLWLTVVAGVSSLLYAGTSILYHNIALPDPNYYFTAARMIMNGKLMYRDIFEQKGPLVYFTHVMALAITPGHRDYGYSVIEFLLMLMLLWFTYRIMRLYLPRIWSAALTLLFPAIFLQNALFREGDTVEITSTAFMMGALYLLLRQMVQPEHRVRWWESGLLGVSVAWILWSKFSLVLMPGLAALVLIAVVWSSQGWREALKHTAFGVLGFGLISGLVLLYFWHYHAVNDLFNVYFYWNLNAYTEAAKLPLAGALLYGAYLGVANALATTPVLLASAIIALLGIFLGPLTPAKGWHRLALFLPLWGVMFSVGYPHLLGYYIYPLVLFVPLALLTLAKLVLFLFPRLADWQPRAWAQASVWLGVTVAMFFLVAAGNPTPRHSRLMEKQPPAIQRFMAPVKSDPHATMMLFGVMDYGFYYYGGNKLPVSKYFAVYNLDWNKFRYPWTDWDQRLADKSVDFVVTNNDRAKSNKHLTDNYRYRSTVHIQGQAFDLYQVRK